jgi:hypothetical protein
MEQTVPVFSRMTPVGLSELKTHRARVLPGIQRSNEAFEISE